jgi:hypothetical protein
MAAMRNEQLSFYCKWRFIQAGAMPGPILALLIEKGIGK